MPNLCPMPRYAIGKASDYLRKSYLERQRFSEIKPIPNESLESRDCLASANRIGHLSFTFCETAW